MSDLTSYTEDEFIRWSFMGEAMATAPSTLYVALHTSDPGQNPDGSTEVSATDYTRASVSSGTGEWSITSSPAPTVIENDNEITFGVANNDWSTVTHFSVWDSETDGNALWVSDLAQSKTVETNDEIRFLAGDLTAQID